MPGLCQGLFDGEHARPCLMGLRVGASAYCQRTCPQKFRENLWDSLAMFYDPAMVLISCTTSADEDRHIQPGACRAWGVKGAMSVG
jgi:hypothetical protein